MHEHAFECVIIIILSRIISIIFNILTIIYIRHDLHKLDKYINNWSSYPISYINTKTDDTSVYSLIDSDFYGTLTYCDCTNSTNSKFKGEIYLDKCTIEQGKSNCIIVPGIPKKSIINWRGKILEKSTSPFFNYFDYIEKKYWENCTQVIGYVDTKNNTLCKNTIYGSPISYIKIIKNDKISQNNSSNRIINLDDNYTLYWGNDNGRIIVDVIIGQDKNGICIDKDEGIFSMNEMFYNRKKGKPKCEKIISNKKYDNRYNLIDNGPIDTEKFFKENKIDNYSYLKEDINDLKLYTVSYFGIDSKCFKFFKKGDFKNNTISDYLMKFFLVICLYIEIYLIYFIFSTVPQGIWSPFEKKKYFSNNLNITIILICSLVIHYINFYNYSRYKSYNCFDEIIKIDYDEFVFPLNISKIFLWISIIVNLISFLACYYL